MNVPNPDAFIQDETALGAVGEAIAFEIGVPASYVDVEAIMMRRLAPEKSMSGRLVNTVKITYTVTMPASSTSTSADVTSADVAEVAEISKRASELTIETLQKAVQSKVQAIHPAWNVQVTSITPAQVVSAIDLKHGTNSSYVNSSSFRLPSLDRDFSSSISGGHSLAATSVLSLLGLAVFQFVF